MEFKDLVALYEAGRLRYQQDTWRYVSAILDEAKGVHYQDWRKKPTRRRDHEQSWRAFKGKNLEKLVEHIVKDEVEALGLGIVNGNKLERTKAGILPLILNKVWQNLQIKCVVDGSSIGHLPDVDLVIYHPNTAAVLAVLSVKVTLRERIAQTGYWKIKLSQFNATEDIRVFLVTPDEDGTLTDKVPLNKGRAIVEVDTHGAYVMTEAQIETF